MNCCPDEFVDKAPQFKHSMGPRSYFLVCLLLLLLVFGLTFPLIVKARLWKSKATYDLINRELEQVISWVSVERTSLGDSKVDAQLNKSNTDRDAWFDLFIESEEPPPIIEAPGVPFGGGLMHVPKRNARVRISLRTPRFGDAVVEILSDEGLYSLQAVELLAAALSKDDVKFKVMQVDNRVSYRNSAYATSNPPPQFYTLGLTFASGIRRHMPFVLGLVLIILGLSQAGIPGTVLCRDCGYDLRGSTGQRCSECGLTITPNSLVLMTTGRRSVYVVIGVILFIVGFLMRDLLEPLFAVAL